MILFQQKFVISVDSMTEVENMAHELRDQHPGSTICDVRKKVVKTKEMEYIHGEIVLEFLDEKLYKQGKLEV